MSRAAHVSAALWIGFLAGSIQAQTVVYVDDSATGANDGTTWANAYPDLQDGLSAAMPGTEVRVAQGSYAPDGGTGNRESTFQLISGVAVYGGYAGSSDPDAADRNFELYETLLSGDLNEDDGPDFANNVENSYHVVTGSGTDASAVIDGFMITAGHADGPSPHDNGGGMYNSGGSPTVRNCFFVGNSANHGGAMHNSGGGATLIDCYFVGNAASSFGGAIDNVSSMPTLVNCVLVGNTAGGEGGAIHSDLFVVTLTNCTISNNAAGNRGGGVFNYVGVSLILTNSILWSNSDAAGDGVSAQLFNNESNTVTVNNTCIQGWTGDFGGIGNIGDNPLFTRAPDPGPDGIWNRVDDDYGDLRLHLESPCVDTGDNNADTDANAPGVQPLPDHDLDGTPRIVHGTVDMGAYEFGAELVPVLSEWGFTIVALLLVSAATLFIRKGRLRPRRC